MPPRVLFSLRLGALGALALAAAGCDQVFESSARRSLDTAERKAKEGEYADAVQHYEAAFDASPKDGDVHYRLALLYDDKLKNPVSALHHFQRYLEISPRGAHSKDARNSVEQLELKLGTSLNKGGIMSQADAARLKNDNLDLRKQLADARKDIADLRASAHAAVQKGGKAADTAQKPIRAGARTYSVQPGDTLASISRRYFKTAGKWKDIQDANFNALEGTVKLKPGMVLMIPEK